jgi:hypothetical protein
LSFPYHITPHPGLDERAFPSMSHDRERERGGDDGYDNVQQNYYQRSWGDHPDLRSLDGRSQASEGQGQGERRHHILFSPYFILFYSILLLPTVLVCVSYLSSAVTPPSDPVSVLT